MIHRVRIAALFGACALACLPAGQAFAWGATGHRLIGRAAVEALPSELPAFLRDPASVEAVGELAREPDRWKGAGLAHDADRDPGHFLDLGDDGRVFGGPALGALPATREGYDTALRAVGVDSWKAGYLPYSIVDGWQQLVEDFAYWRVDTAGAARSGSHRPWFLVDRRAREAPAAPRPGNPRPLCRRRQSAPACHPALQWLGPISEPVQLHPGQGARAVRG